MKAPRSTVISMRLPAESGKRLKRLAHRHGWTASDASARLVEEGLRRSEFAFIDFRDSAAGRQAYIQGSSLAVWEIVLLVRSHHGDIAATAKHLGWAPSRVAAAVHYADAFREEVDAALAENQTMDVIAIQRMLPQTEEFPFGKKAGRNRAEIASR
jgi:hypothetical protein